MYENYTQTLQDQIGQLGKLLGVPNGTALPEVAQPAANRFDCVDGLEGARSFLVKMLPSTKHIVWDNQRDMFYVLQKDANGQAARIQMCAYTVEYEPTMEEKYVSRDDFNALVAKLDALLSQKEVTDG
jgi:hypothetical protein